MTPCRPKRPVLVLAATLTALSLPARADPAPTDAPPTTLAPVDVPHPPRSAPSRLWLRHPNGQDMADNYPLNAAQGGINGRALLVCTVAINGRLTACAATSVSPPGQNFDLATVRLGRYFQFDVTPKGDPTLVGAQIAIPIGWVAPRFQ